jgi:hypothetical protein
LIRCIDDIIPAFGNKFCSADAADICFKNETSTIKVFEDISADAVLQARDDSESHFETSQELRPDLAFMQNTGAWPKFADNIVIEALPDDSKTYLFELSLIGLIIRTASKLNVVADLLTEECREARTTTGETACAWELLPIIDESERQTCANIEVPPDRILPVGPTMEKELPIIEAETLPLDGPLGKRGSNKT